MGAKATSLDTKIFMSKTAGLTTDSRVTWGNAEIENQYTIWNTVRGR